MRDARNNFFENRSRLFEDDFLDYNDAIMKTDITKNKDGYTLSMDLPGMKKENIHIDYENEYLMVQAIREETIKEDYIRKEKYYGSYKRSFYVGAIDQNKIKAHYQHGILTITFPSAQMEYLKKQIPID